MVKNYVMPGEAVRILGVCDRTLRYWEEPGKITAIRTAGGQRRYDITTCKLNSKTVRQMRSLGTLSFQTNS